MNRQGARFGLLSLVFATLALLLSVAAVHFENIQGVGSAYVLEWMDARGLVRQPAVGAIAEMRNPSRFLITDRVATRWLVFHAWWFAACAMLLALFAEYKREETLLLSAGFVTGAMALVLFNTALSVCVMAIGWLCVMRLRRRAQA